METTATKESFSNIITPPDFIGGRDHTVLLIDPTWSEIEDLALYLKTSPETFNVYVYRCEMQDAVWLSEAMKKASVLIINTVDNEISHAKDALAAQPTDVWTYGPKRFLMNPNQIESPIEYFAAYLK